MRSGTNIFVVILTRESFSLSLYLEYVLYVLVWDSVLYWIVVFVWSVSWLFDHPIIATTLTGLFACDGHVYLWYVQPQQQQQLIVVVAVVRIAWIFFFWIESIQFAFFQNHSLYWTNFQEKVSIWFSSIHISSTTTAAILVW